MESGIYCTPEGYRLLCSPLMFMGNGGLLKFQWENRKKYKRQIKEGTLKKVTEKRRQKKTLFDFIILKCLKGRGNAQAETHCNPDRNFIFCFGFFTENTCSLPCKSQVHKKYKKIWKHIDEPYDLKPYTSQSTGLMAKFNYIQGIKKCPYFFPYFSDSWKIFFSVSSLGVNAILLLTAPSLLAIS